MKCTCKVNGEKKKRYFPTAPDKVFLFFFVVVVGFFCCCYFFNLKVQGPIVQNLTQLLANVTLKFLS